jgi:hypothetical protein
MCIKFIIPPGPILVDNNKINHLNLLSWFGIKVEDLAGQKNKENWRSSVISNSDQKGLIA